MTLRNIKELCNMHLCIKYFRSSTLSCLGEMRDMNESCQNVSAVTCEQAVLIGIAKTY